MHSRRATQSHDTRALVLRRTAYGEADLILSAFTETLGQVSILARSARKSQKRFGGTLEPLHTLRLALDEPRGSELLRLRDARIDRPRPHLLGHLDGMEAAGRFLGWVRHAAPRHTREPELWALTLRCLDQLESNAEARSPGANAKPSATLTLARHGLALLTVCGWRLELEHCVLSGQLCPPGKAAMIDPARGGLVSRSRGGAPFSLSGPMRQRLIEAQRGAADALRESDADLSLSLVERCLEAHAGLARA